MNAEPTMANNTEDIENNMVSTKDNIFFSFLSVWMCWVMISKEFYLCVTQCFSIWSVMKERCVTL